MSTHALSFKLSFLADWTTVELIRHAVTLSCQAAFRSRELADSIGMVSAELLENAVKYTDTPEAPIRFSLAAEGPRAVLRVINRVADSESIARLRGALEWVASFPTAQDAYVNKIQELADTGLGDGGLGLVRVAYEGGCQLRCDIDGDRGEVQIEALFEELRA